MSRGCPVCFGRGRACRCGVVEDDETEFEQVDRTREGLLDRAGVLALLRTQEGHPDEAEVIRALVREVRSRLPVTADALTEREAVVDYLSFRIEMSHYGAAIKEMLSVRDIVERGAHLVRPWPDEPPDYEWDDDLERLADDDTTGAEMRLLHDQALRFERGEHRREEQE